MTATVRVKRTFPRHNAGPEHHWMLVSPAGVLTFCTIECSPDFAHAWVDGAPWMSWGIDAHIPSDLCGDPDPEHSHTGLDGCGLLEGIPCCVVAAQSSAGRDLLNRWLAAGRDDELIWAYLDDRYPDMVTANVNGGDQ